MKDCWENVRNSGPLVIILVFCNLVSDSLLLTLVDPILPDILRNIDNLNTETLNDTSRTIPQTFLSNVSKLTHLTSDLKASINALDILQNETFTRIPPDTEIVPDELLLNTTGPSISESINMNGRYGILVAAKGAMQFVCNPFVGFTVTRYGYRRPMLIGSISLFATTVAFAFGNTYVFLFITRLLQGAASSVTAVTGLGLLATTFRDEAERGKVIGVAIGGISLGIIVGPLYGSLLYQFFGQAMPFLVLSAMVLFAIGLQILGFRCDTGVKDHTPGAILKLAADPYILIVAGNIFLLNLVVSIILAFLPVRLIDLEDPETWKLGIVVLPSSIGYLLAGLIFPRTTKCLPRWLCGMVGQILGAGTVIGLAFCMTFESMLVVTTFTGLAVGMVSTSMQPIFATIVDLRHSSVYGNVYAISDMSVCAAFFIGPLLGGPLMYAVGFQWMVISVGCLSLSFSIFSIFLRNPTAKNKLKSPEVIQDKDEKRPILEDLLSPPRSRASSAGVTRSRARTVSGYAVPRYFDHLSDLEDNYLSDMPVYRSPTRSADVDDSYLSDIPPTDYPRKQKRILKKYSRFDENFRPYNPSRK